MYVNRKRTKCLKCGSTWKQMRKEKPPIALISLENRQVQYIACEEKLEIVLQPGKRYNEVKHCPNCTPILWDYQDGIPDSLKHLRSRLRTKARMILNFKNFIYTRLLAGNKVPINIDQNQFLQFTIFGDFILTSDIMNEKAVEIIIPPLQAISRIAKFATDLEKEELFKTVASKLTWFAGLNFKEDKRTL